MKKTEKVPKTVDMTPSWEACVRIHIACLENSKASALSKYGARNEIIRLAKHVDNLKKTSSA